MNHITKTEYRTICKELAINHEEAIAGDAQHVATSMTGSIQFGVAPQEGAVISYGTAEFDERTLCPYNIISCTDQSESVVHDDIDQTWDDVETDCYGVLYAIHALKLDLLGEINGTS